VRRIEVVDPRRRADARVGDADIEAAEESFRLGDEARDLRRVGDVAGQPGDGRAAVFEHGRRRLGALGVAAADHHPGAFVGQRLGDGETDASRPAGDEGHAVPEDSRGAHRTASRPQSTTSVAPLTYEAPPPAR